VHRLIFIFGGTLIFSLLCLLPYAVWQGWLSPDDATVQAQQPQATPVIVESPQPTQEPKPTPNIEATAQAQASAQSAQLTFDAARINLDAAERNFEAAKVEAAAAVQAAQIAADAQGRTDAAMIRLAEVEGDYAIRLAELQLEIVQAQTDLMHAQTELHRQERANNEFILQAVMVATIAVIAVIAVIMAIRGRFRQEQEYEYGEDDEQDEAEEDFSWLPSFPANVPLKRYTEHVPVKSLVAIARGVTAGEPFTHNHWVRGKNVISEGKFMTLQRLMVPDLARWANESNHRLGCIPNEKAIRFFQKISYPAPSPPQGDAPVTPVQPRTDTIRHNNDPLPAGEGWSKPT
jgi:hypothetical protein